MPLRRLLVSLVLLAACQPTTPEPQQLDAPDPLPAEPEHPAPQIPPPAADDRGLKGCSGCSGKDAVIGDEHERSPAQQEAATLLTAIDNCTHGTAFSGDGDQVFTLTLEGQGSSTDLSQGSLNTLDAGCITTVMDAFKAPAGHWFHAELTASRKHRSQQRRVWTGGTKPKDGPARAQ